jgi:hypothetical protein
MTRNPAQDALDHLALATDARRGEILLRDVHDFLGKFIACRNRFITFHLPQLLALAEVER